MKHEQLEPKYINRSGVSCRLLLSIPTIKRMEKDGRLRPYKFGAGSVRYLIKDIEQLEAEALAAKQD